MDKNWMLGLIIEAIRALDDPRGSRVSETFAVVDTSTSSEQSMTFAVKSELFKRALLYGVRLDLLRPSCGGERFRVRKSGLGVTKFLTTLRKALPPHGKGKCHREERQFEAGLRFRASETSLTELEVTRGKVRPRSRRNRSAMEPKVTRCKEPSEYSDSECEFI